MIQIRKYRLYPYPDQEKILNGQIETCRQLWNGCLAWRSDVWQYEHKSVSAVNQMKRITQTKKSNIYLSNIYSHVSQDVIKRLDKAYLAFFKHIARYPKRKKYGQYTSITYPDAYNGCVKLGSTRKNTKIYLSKIGYVPIVVHREPPNGINKRCTIKKESNSWYAILEYDITDEIPEQKCITNPIGGDLGIMSTLTMSNGKKYIPPAPLKRHEKNVKHLQRSVSRKKKGSKNRAKAIKKLNKKHHKIANIRRDSNHKISFEIAGAYDFVALEDLNIKNMVKDNYMAKAIHDRGWNQLSRFISYKMVRQGKLFVVVPPHYTSQICNSCGHSQEMPLHIRWYNCPVCGVNIDRDENAAKNILEKGLSQVGRDTAELMPVEKGVQLMWTTTSAKPSSETGTTFPGV
jgi:putative transposase